MPKISCIMPVYNCEDTLERSAGSILNQTFSDYELILVDDCSTDGSYETMLKMAETDCRIKLFRMNQNSGAANCRNYGYSKSSGEYVMFLDADDYFFPELFEKTYLSAVEYDADVVVFGSENVYVSDEYKWNKGKTNLPERGVYKYDEMDNFQYGLCRFVPWNKLICSKLIRNNKLYFQNVPNSNDIFFSLTVTAYADKFVFIDDVLVRYYAGNSGSLTESKKKRMYYMEAFCASWKTIYYDENMCGDRKKRILNYLVKIIRDSFYNDAYTNTIINQALNTGRSDTQFWKSFMDYVEKSNTISSYLKKEIEWIIRTDYDCDVLREQRDKYIYGWFRDKYVKGEKIAIWGYGKRGRRIVDYLVKLDCFQYVYCIIDENCNKMEKGQHSAKKYADVKNDIDSVVITIANTDIVDDIKKQIDNNAEIYISENEFGYL